MIEVEKFILALKSTWYRKFVKEKTRIILQQFTTIFVTKICPIMEHIEECGSHFINQKMNQIHNPFWKDVLISVSHLLPVPSKTWEEFLVIVTIVAIDVSV